MKSGCCSKFPHSLGLCQSGNAVWANHSQELEAALKGKRLLCWMHNIKILSCFTSRLNPEWINYEIRINPIILCFSVPGIRWCICKDSVSYGKWDHHLSYFIKSLSQTLTAWVRGCNEIKLKSLLFDWLPLHIHHWLQLPTGDGWHVKKHCDCWDGMQGSSNGVFPPLDMADNAAGLVGWRKPENITVLLKFNLQTSRTVGWAKRWSIPPWSPVTLPNNQVLNHLSPLFPLKPTFYTLMCLGLNLEFALMVCLLQMRSGVGKWNFVSCLGFFLFNSYDLTWCLKNSLVLRAPYSSLPSSLKKRKIKSNPNLKKCCYMKL